MWSLWIIVAVLGCLSSLALADDETKYGDPFYLEQQKDLLVVLKYVHQPQWNADLYAFGHQYKISEDYDNYNNVEQVREFVDLYERDGLLPRTSFFSLYNVNHLQQTKSLFNVLYNAKNYETLAQAVSWSRFHVNEKMFMYVLGLIISHRQDVSSLIMPPPYEFCPYQYINSEAIKTAQRMTMQGFIGVDKVNGLKEVIIPMNYTGWYMHMNDDQKLTYLTEDPAYNAFYYNFNVDYPFWMEGKDYGLDKDRRGELYITMHQQLLARYYLERLSNGLGHIQDFNWRQPIKSGYNPSLMYVNGKQFPSRPNNYNLYTEGNRKFVKEAEDRERRIRDIVDQGFVEHGGKVFSFSKAEDVNMLGNLLQGNSDSSDLHHNFHQHILPTYLQNYSTAARDPLFYQFYKRLINIYWKFMKHIKPYSYDEIAFPGVKITSVQVDKIETFFENFDIDITNAVDVVPEPIAKDKGIVTEVNFKPDEYFIKTRTVRLNHKPFTFRMKVQSDVEKKAIVRVFIGPKYDEFGTSISFKENRKNFVLLHAFIKNLKAGENVFVEHSDRYSFFGGDQTSFYDLYKRVMSAKKGDVAWDQNLFKGRCQAPKHLMIPKGKAGGMTYQFYFVVSPFEEPKTPWLSTFNGYQSCGIGSGSRYIEDRSLLYPLDREIDSTFFFTPNMHFEDVEIHFNEENAARYF